MNKSETKIVFIDDDKKYEEDALSSEIRSHFSKLEIFSIPQEALKYIEDNIKDNIIVLLDLRFSSDLPDGYNTLSKIKKISKLIPVIIFSATQKDEINATALINNGTYRYLDKDSSSKEIIGVLQEADIAIQNSLPTAIKEWLEARESDGSDEYIYTLSSKRYSLKEVIDEILKDTEMGQFFAKNINKLSIDLLSRRKEKIND